VPVLAGSSAGSTCREGLHVQAPVPVPVPVPAGSRRRAPQVSVSPPVHLRLARRCFTRRGRSATCRSALRRGARALLTWMHCSPAGVWSCAAAAAAMTPSTRSSSRPPVRRLWPPWCRVRSICVSVPWSRMLLVGVSAPAARRGGRVCQEARCAGQAAMHLPSGLPECKWTWSALSWLMRTAYLLAVAPAPARGRAAPHLLGQAYVERGPARSPQPSLACAGDAVGSFANARRAALAAHKQSGT